jgi:SNF family Na+-dependent transporter
MKGIERLNMIFMYILHALKILYKLLNVTTHKKDDLPAIMNCINFSLHPSTSHQPGTASRISCPIIFLQRSTLYINDFSLFEI